MAFEPKSPQVHYAPQEVAENTFVIRQMQEAAIGPLWLYLNSMVIRGSEPVIVDTGTPANRERWMEDVFPSWTRRRYGGYSYPTITLTILATWPRSWNSVQTRS